MDWYRVYQLEKKKEKYEKEGMNKKQVEQKLKKDDQEAKKELDNQKTFFAGAPFLGYNPYTSVLVGAGANVSHYYGDKENTHLSAFNILAFYSVNSQASFRFINQVYFPNDKVFLTGFFNGLTLQVIPLGLEEILQIQMDLSLNRGLLNSIKIYYLEQPEIYT